MYFRMISKFFQNQVLLEMLAEILPEMSFIKEKNDNILKIGYIPSKISKYEE